jgi:hypothetical protein
MNDRTQGYFVRAIGAGIILDVVIEVIREIAFEIRTGGLTSPLDTAWWIGGLQFLRRLFSLLYRS